VEGDHWSSGWWFVWFLTMAGVVHALALGDIEGEPAGEGLHGVSHGGLYTVFRLPLDGSLRGVGTSFVFVLVSCRQLLRNGLWGWWMMLVAPGGTLITTISVSILFLWWVITSTFCLFSSSIVTMR
jgi:hypothetical protein